MDLALIKFAVDTSELKKAQAALDNLGKSVSALGEVQKKLSTESSKTQKTVKDTASATEQSAKSVKVSTDVLQKQTDVLAFMANGFTKGQASVLAFGKASGLSAKQMQELQKVLESIFKLAGKNPFDDSVDPVKRLRGEIEKTANQIKVLRGETNLTAKQLNELSVAQARAEELGRQRGLRGAALQSTVNKATREFIALADEANKQTSEKSRLLDESTRKARQEAEVLKQAAREQANLLKEQNKLRELATKTTRIRGLKEEGFSTTSANQIFRMEKAGIPKAEIDSFRVLRKEIDALSASKLSAAVAGEKLKLKMDGLQGVVRALIPGFGAVTVGALIGTFLAKLTEVTDAYSMLQSRIKLTGVSGKELATVNEKLLVISNETRTSLNDNTQLYVKLANALSNFGGSSTDALNVTNAFSKALVIGGANTKEAAAATLQFAQALGSGKLAGDEFRSIAEASPRVLQAIADGTGKTTGELKKLASEGFLTTATVTKALVSQMTILDIEMQSITPTVSQAFKVMGNALTSLVGELNQSTGVTAKVAGGIMSLANSIPTASEVLNTFSSVSNTVGNVLSEVTKILFAAGVAYTLYSTLVSSSAASTTSLSAAQIFSAGVTRATAGAMALYTGAVALATTGTNALTVAILANPAGAILTAIAVAVAAVGAGLAYAFSDEIFAKISKITDGLLGFSSAADKASSSRIFQQTNDAFGFEISGLEKEIEQLNEELNKGEQNAAKRAKNTEEALKRERQLRIDNANELFALGKISDKQYNEQIAQINKVDALRRKKQALAEENANKIKDKEVPVVDKFNLAGLSKVFEQELSNANRFEQQQRKLIDANLQYRLISEGEAYVQREKLAEESYKRDRAIVAAQLSKVQAEGITGKTEDQRRQQEEAKRSEVERLKLKIEQLDVDRQNAVVLANIAFIGQENERNLENQQKLQRIRADIEQDITALITEQQNQYKDPAVVAAEQARIKAADKYTETIAKLIQEEKFLLDIRKATTDPESLARANEQLQNVGARIAEARKQQTEFSDKIAEATQRSVEFNRSFEAGVSKAIAERRNQFNDLSKIGYEFVQGFYKEFDDVLTNLLENGKLKFGKLFKYIRDQIKKVIIEQLFLRPIKVAIEMVGGNLGEIIKGFFGGVSGNSSGLLSAGNSFLNASNGLDGIAGDKSIASQVSSFSKIVDAVKGVKSLSDVATLFSKGVTGIETSIYNGFARAANAAGITGEANIAFANTATNFVAAPAIAYTGYQLGRNVSGGYSLNGGTGNGTVNTGATAGAIAGGIIGAGNPIAIAIGSAIGSVIGGVVNRAFGKKTTTVLGAGGVEGTFNKGGFSGRGFQDIITTTKKGFLRGGGSSTSVSTQYSELSKEVLAQLSSDFNALKDSALVSSRVLGFDVKKALDKVVVSGRFSVQTEEEYKATLDQLAETIVKQVLPSTKTITESVSVLGRGFSGLSGEVEGFFSGFFKTVKTTTINVISNLEKFREAGENLIQTIGRLATAITTANTASILLGKGTEFSLVNAEKALSLQKNLGDSIKNLEQVMALFVPSTELAARQLELFNMNIKNLGLSSQITENITRDEFAKLLKGVDLQTDVGQKQLATLLDIAPSVDAIIKQREETQAKQREQQLSLLRNSPDSASLVAALIESDIPKFASGGAYAGGLALVGERGPELINFNKPGYVFNAQQTQGMLSGSSSDGSLSADIQGLRSDSRISDVQMIKVLQRVAKVLERWDAEGQPETRVV